MSKPTTETFDDDAPAVRYTTDDMDIDRRVHELCIQPGGNGDWYVAIAPQGTNAVHAVRITTSGSRVSGLAAAIANAYRAILAAGSRAVIVMPGRASAPSDPPAPDASTDAVREALRHSNQRTLTSSQCGLEAHSACHQMTRCDCVCHPLLAAIADADKRAKDAERAVDDNWVSHQQIIAMRSERDASEANLKAANVENAALTRKLAVARFGLERLVHHGTETQQPSGKDFFADGRDHGTRIAARSAANTLAAIDAPAHRHSNTCVLDRFGKCTASEFEPRIDTPAAEEAADNPLDSDCSSCGEECAPPMECPASRRQCGHHCNCSWSQDECCWCGKEFGEEVTDASPPEPANAQGRELSGATHLQAGGERWQVIRAAIGQRTNTTPGLLSAERFHQ
jgi:hypothetical protein